MKRFDSQLCKITSMGPLTKDVFDLRVSAPQLAELASPGQFAQILVPGHTLRRPISLCGMDRQRGELRFVFQIRGQGTRELAAFRAGDSLEILAPLGQGFPLDTSKRTLLLGGGIGVPPLLGAAEALGERAVAVLGFRSRDAVILEEDFRRTGARVLVATDDGSYGFRGLVTELAAGEDFQVLMACGPGPMLRGARALAEAKGAAGYLSLEQRMACGVGACLGCAVALVDPEGREYYGHVCKDGPVFPMERIAGSAL